MEKPKEPTLNILVADDDPDDQFILQKVIWEYNPDFKVASVYNGQQLLDYLAREGAYKNSEEPFPDCIFLDLSMPVLGGKDVLEKLSKLEEWNDLQIYILTSSNSAAEKSKLLEMGAVDFLTKTYDLTRLREMMRTTLNEIYTTVIERGQKN